MGESKSRYISLPHLPVTIQMNRSYASFKIILVFLSKYKLYACEISCSFSCQTYVLDVKKIVLKQRKHIRWMEIKIFSGCFLALSFWVFFVCSFIISALRVVFFGRYLPRIFHLIACMSKRQFAIFE